MGESSIRKLLHETLPDRATRMGIKYQGEDLNLRPRAYESPALPLSYPGMMQFLRRDELAPDPSSSSGKSSLRETLT